MQYLTTKEAARVVGLAPNTLAKLRMSGKGPKYAKNGRTVRYTPAWLKDWMEARTGTAVCQFWDTPA